MTDLRKKYTKKSLQEDYDNDVLPEDVLKDVSNSRINRDLKLQHFRNPKVNALDYINDVDVPKSDIIEARLRKIRAENIEEATRVKITEELSKTPSREKLRKWEAQSILQLEKLNSGGVK